MHRCNPEAGTGAVVLRGRTAAGPVALFGGAAILVAYLLATTGVWRPAPFGLGGVMAAGVLAQVAVLIGLRAAISSCSVRRSVMGAFVQLTLATAGALALNA